MSFFFLAPPSPDDSKLPVPQSHVHKLRRNHQKAKQRSPRTEDHQIVCEFRAKLRKAEEMISKLAFSLNEIQGMREASKKPRRARVSRTMAAVTELIRR